MLGCGPWVGVAPGDIPGTGPGRPGGSRGPGRNGGHIGPNSGRVGWSGESGGSDESDDGGDGGDRDDGHEGNEGADGRARRRHERWHASLRETLAAALRELLDRLYPGATPWPAHNDRP